MVLLWIAVKRFIQRSQRPACLLILLAVWLLSGLRVEAQPRLSALDLPDNVSGRAINHLHLDHAGFLWIVSGSRLFRFDGEQARPMLDHSQQPVGSAVVVALSEQAGQIYLLTERSFSRVAGSEQLQTLAVADTEGTLFSAALALEQHWLLGTDSGELRIIAADAETGSPEHRFAALDGRIIALLASGPASAIAFAADGSFRQLYWRNGRWSQGVLRRLRLPVASGEPLRALALTAQGRVFAGVAGLGLFASSLETSIQRDYVVELDMQPLLADIDVNTLAVQGSAILVGTDRGLYRLPADARDESQLSIYDTGNSELLHEEILSLHPVESARAVLVGTFEGIAVLRDVPFGLAAVGAGARQRLQVMGDWAPNAVVLGTYAGMYLYRTDVGSVEPVPLSEGHFSDHRVMSLGLSTDYLIRGYRSRGLDVVAREDGALIAHLDRKSSPGLASDGVSVIADVGDDRWLIGTYGGGAALLTIEGGAVRVVPLELPSGGREQYVVQHCHVDQQLLLITEAGPYAVQIDGEAWIGPLHFPPSEPHPSRFWLCHQDDRGRLWFAGDDGELLSYAPEQLEELLRGEPLVAAQRFQLDQEILAMRADQFDNLWAVTRTTLLMVPADGSLIEQYTAAQGLPDVVFNYGSALRTDGGMILFGSSAGVFRVEPDSMVQNTLRRDLRLSWFRNDGSRFKPTDVFEQPAVIEVRHPSQFLAVRLFAGNVLQPGALRFRHRLEGLEEGWLYGDSGSIAYAQLPPGNYQLRVQTSLDQQTWPDADWSIPIRVAGDPLRTPWALASLLALMLLLLIALLAWWRSQRRELSLGTEARGARSLADRALSGLQSTLLLRQRLLRELAKSSVSSYDTLVRLTMHNAPHEPEDGSFTVARLRAVQQAHLCSFAEGDRLLLDLHIWLEGFWPELLQTLDLEAEPVLINALLTAPIELGKALELVSLVTELMLISLTASISPTQRDARLRLSLTPAADGSGYILELNDTGEQPQFALAQFDRGEESNPAEQRAIELGLLLTASASVQRRGLDVSTWLEPHWLAADRP